MTERKGKGPRKSRRLVLIIVAAAVGLLFGWMAAEWFQRKGDQEPSESPRGGETTRPAEPNTSEPPG